MTVLGTCWPDEVQQELLVAAYGDATPARRAVERWWSQIDLDEVDAGSFRLLPMLHANLTRHAIPAPSARLRGIHRQAVYRNRLLLRRLAEELAVLTTAGIDHLVLKGAALGPRYYPDVGARPMGDVDVLVRLRDVGRADAHLQARGWQPEREIDRRTLVHSHAVAYRHAEGWELDLHWTVLPGIAAEPGGLDPWRHARGLTIDGVETMTLDATDELLLTLVHGLGWDVVPSIRWVGDALLLCRQPIDWDRLTDTAVRLGLALPVADALLHLSVIYGADIPAEVHGALSATPVAGWHRVELWTRQRSYASIYAYVVALVLATHRRVGARPFATAVLVPDLVAWRLGITRAGEVPAAILAWGRRLQQRRRRHR